LTLSTTTYASYLWKDEDGNQIGNGQTLNVASAGTYTVEVQKSGVTNGPGISLPFIVTRTPISKNYVYSRAIMKGGITSPSLLGTLTDKDQVQGVSYQDGLGRTIQSVGIGQSGDQKDVIAPVAYNKRGLADTTYLPYVSTTKDGTFRSNAIKYPTSYSSSEQELFYNATSTQPYAVSVFRNAPDARITEQGSTGASWQPGQHTQTSSIALNSSSYPVRYFKPDGTSSNNYPDNTVMFTKMFDENGFEVRTFTNSLGQTVKKQVEVSSGTYLETNYAYDEFGQLKYQMPPKTQFDADPNMESDTQPQDFIYKYKYDNFGRVIEKKKPGSAAEYFIYDKLGRLVLTQDGILRATNQWFFVKYDFLNRPVYSGLYTNATQVTRTDVQNLFNAIDYSSAPKYEADAVNATYQGYTNNVFPTSSLTVLSANYYDHYDFDRTSGADYSFDNTTGAIVQGGPTASTRGFSTGSRTRIMGTNNWLVNYVFYDGLDRVLQVRSNNHLNLSVLDNITYVYADRAGHVNEMWMTHNGLSVANHVIRYEYDVNWRTNAIYHTLNGGTEQQVSAYAYNQLGQLIDRKLHKDGLGNFLQSVDYRYHLHGQLVSINNETLAGTGPLNDDVDDYFGMEIQYENVVSGLGSTAQYNGNISSVTWKGLGADRGTSLDRRAYAYTYDRSDRLTQGTFKMYGASSWNQELNTLDEGATYDVNGNILTLNRNQNLRGSSGITITNTAQTMDGLTYTYATGNQVSKVEDSGNDEGFKNGTINGTNEYTYDVVGSLTADKNKGIDSVKYNELGKVRRIKYTDGRVQTYTYAASGAKLTTKTYSASGVILTTTDYVGGMQYENNEIKYQPLPEGRITRNSKSMLDDNRIHGTTTTGFQALNSTITAVTQNSETYVKVSSSGAGLMLSGVYIAKTVAIQANKKYVLKAKGYAQNTAPYLPSLYVKSSTGVESWSVSSLLPASSNEGWLSYEFTTPTGATSVDLGVFWPNTVSVPSGTEFYVNETDFRLIADEYHYSIADNQGNTRVVFSSVPGATQEIIATVEDSDPDSGAFNNYSSVFRSSMGIYNHTSGGSHSGLLNGGHNGHIGYAKSYKVYPGDKVKIEAYAKYSGNNGTTDPIVTPMATALLAAFGLPAPGVGEVGTPSAGLNQYGSIDAGGSGPSSSGPKAFVNIILFDKDHKFLDFAYVAIDPAAEQVGVSPVVSHDHMVKEYTVKQAGYAYMYVSNENPTLVDVYFDDVKMTYTPGNVLQYSEYYPFGMRTAYSWDRGESGALANEYLYNAGGEYNKTANWYEMSARRYDPVLGRMNGVDPSADKYSSLTPYNYAFNNPVLFNDPSGADPDDDGGYDPQRYNHWREEHAQRMVYMERSKGPQPTGYRAINTDPMMSSSGFESAYLSAGGYSGTFDAITNPGFSDDVWSEIAGGVDEVWNNTDINGVGIWSSGEIVYFEGGPSYGTWMPEYTFNYKEYSDGVKGAAYNVRVTGVVKVFQTGPAQGAGESAPNSAFTMRRDDVDHSTLFNEFWNGTGPEYSGFDANHSMTKDLKNSLIVKMATVQFLANNADNIKNNKPLQPLISYDTPFGLVGAATSTTMTEQFIGGARISIIPYGASTLYIVNNTTGWYSLMLHSEPDIPRDPESRTPHGNIYQRFIWTNP
jgi:RHS repeat-associated protein